MNPHLKIAMYWFLSFLFLPVGLNIIIFSNNNPIAIILAFIIPISLICLMLNSIRQIIKKENKEVD